MKKLIAYTGLYWFLMDVSWYWQMKVLCIIFTLMTLTCTLLLFAEKNDYDRKDTMLNQVLAIAINSWFLLNVTAMIIELFTLSQVNVILFKIFGAFFSISGLISLLLLIIIDKNSINKFRRL